MASEGGQTAQGRQRHFGGTLGDMVRTSLIFVVIIVVVVLVTRGKHPTDASHLRVDYSAQVSTVRAEAPFTVLAPVGLPAAWVATHATGAVPQGESKTATLDIGFYVPAPNDYVALEQSNAPGWVVAKLGKTAHRTGSQTITGETWQTWVDASGAPALVRTTGAGTDGSTVVLDGHAHPATLTTLAASLRS